MRTQFLASSALAPLLTIGLLLGACTHTVKSYGIRPTDQEAETSGKQPVRDVSKEQVSQSLTRVADSLRETGDYRTAIGVYQRARTADPKDPAISLGLAKALWAVGDWEDAGRAFEDTHALDPANREARIGIANALVMTNRLDEAAKQFQNLIVDMPQEPKVYSGLGIVYDLQGRHQDAQLRYGMGLEVAPNDSALKNNLALSFALAHDYATAIELLRGLPDNPSTRQTTALVYGLSNKPNEAAKFARIDLNETDVQNNLDYYAWLRSLDGKAQAEAVLLGRVPAGDGPQSSVAANDIENAPPPVPVPAVKQAAIEPAANAKPRPSAKSPAVTQPQPVSKPVVRRVPEVKPQAAPEPPLQLVTVTGSPIAPEPEAEAPAPASVVEQPAPKPQRPATLYQAQFASFRTYEETEGVKESLVRNHADLLTGFDLVIEEADLGPEKGSFHRLRTAPVSDKNSAQALCRALKATGTACYVVKVTGVANVPSQPQG